MTDDIRRGDALACQPIDNRADRRTSPGRDFDDVESEMSSDWSSNRGASTLNWERAKHAARDTWNRIGLPG